MIVTVQSLTVQSVTMPPLPPAMAATQFRPVTLLSLTEQPVIMPPIL